MGRDASSPISRIVMGKWLEKVREVELRTKEMNEINPVQYEALDIKLAKKYVDDVLASLYRMKLGTHWDREKGLLIWSQEKEMEHKEKGMTEDQVTTDTFAELASAQYKCLKFTSDHPESNKNKGTYTNNTSK